MDNDETTISASEARVHLGEMLRRVRKGEHIVIEKGGIPTAALIDVSDYEEYRRLKTSGAGAAKPRAILSSPTPDGLERLKRSFGGWKDMDIEEFRRKIRASRQISTRPPVKLD